MRLVGTTLASLGNLSTIGDCVMRVVVVGTQMEDRTRQLRSWCLVENEGDRKKKSWNPLEEVSKKVVILTVWFTDGTEPLLCHGKSARAISKT